MILRKNLRMPKLVALFLPVLLAGALGSCDLIRMKKEPEADGTRKPVARVNDSFLYLDELAGITADNVSKEDSMVRTNAYINNWIRKQLLINEAMKTIDIDEAEVERKILEYRYSLIGYQYQNFYIKQNLDDSVSEQEIQAYYNEHIDNFILKQNIIRGTFIVVPKGAPRVSRLKELVVSNKEKDQNELKSYCLSFSTAYHLSDSLWMEFDKLVVGSPLSEIPNKVQFLKNNSYYETSDADSFYFLKVDQYKISDNVSPIEFVRSEIANIILNKRKVELVKKLEDEVYENAANRKEFEIYN